jgi:hypothetical protein
MSPAWISSARAWALGAVVVAAACKPSDGTGPTTPYKPPPGVDLKDPEAAITGIAGFEATWTSPAIRSSTGLASVVLVPAGTAPARAPQCGAGPAAAPMFSPLGVIPDSDFGRIFVYDSVTAKFVAGPTSGGPSARSTCSMCLRRVVP